jgi:hypothetical protein
LVRRIWRQGGFSVGKSYPKSKSKHGLIEYQSIFKRCLIWKEGTNIKRVG